MIKNKCVELRGLVLVTPIVPLSTYNSVKSDNDFDEKMCVSGLTPSIDVNRKLQMICRAWFVKEIVKEVLILKSSNSKNSVQGYTVYGPNKL